MGQQAAWCPVQHDRMPPKRQQAQSVQSDVRVASRIGQFNGGATTAGLTLAWKQSLSLSRASALSLRALNPVAHSRAPCGHHVVVHDDMAATAVSGASREWLFQLLLVRDTSLHASCVRLGALVQSKQRNAARSDSRPKC